MAKITKLLDSQSFQDDVFEKLKKEFSVWDDKILRRIAHNAVVEFCEKGTNTIVENYFKQENKE